MAEQKRIVLVDDDPEVLDIVGRRLRADGYDVHTAGNGLDGLKLIQQVKPNLAILDIMMPDIDGVALNQAIKEDKTIASTPTIFLSALETDLSEAGLLSTFEVKAFLGKPVQLEILSRKVARILAGKD